MIGIGTLQAKIQKQENIKHVPRAVSCLVLLSGGEGKE